MTFTEGSKMADRYQDNSDGRSVSILIIFLLLIGFSAVGVWFWMNQEQPGAPVEVASSTHPALEPLAPAEILDRTPVSDEEAVAEGTLARFDDNRWLESERFVGTDKDGRQANLRIYILSQNYSWLFGDGSGMTGPDGTADLDALLSGGDFQTRFCGAESILAIGTSSFEGAQELNHRLARARARRLVSALSAQLGSCPEGGPKLLGASLGEHAETSPCPGRERCPEATSSQRRLILVGVEAGSDNSQSLNYSEALWSGMRRFDTEQDSFFKDFRLADYDQFEVLE